MGSQHGDLGEPLGRAVAYDQVGGQDAAGDEPLAFPVEARYESVFGLAGACEP